MIEIHPHFDTPDESVISVDEFRTGSRVRLKNLVIAKINTKICIVHLGMFKLFGVPKSSSKFYRKWTWETDEKYLEKMNFCFPHLDTVGALEIISRAIKLGSEAKNGKKLS